MDLEMIHRSGRGILLAGVAALLQGCLAAGWLAAVGVGTSMSGSVHLEPFENTWVAPAADASVALDHMNSVAVTSFLGDDAMAPRFAVAFRQMSTLRVVGPEELRARSVLASSTTRSSPMRAGDRPRLARAIASQARVDCVLFGTVVAGGVQTDKWGNKEVTSYRLKITLTDGRGQALWKDELPYRIIEAAQPFPEEWFQETLTTHLAAHARSIGLVRIAAPDEEMQMRFHSRLDPSARF